MMDSKTTEEKKINTLNVKQPKEIWTSDSKTEKPSNTLCVTNASDLSKLLRRFV